MANSERVSICLDQLYAASKAGHPSVTKHNNGKTYINLTLWFNDKEDQYGNDISVQLTQPKDYTEKATYVGNGRRYKAQGAAPAPAAKQTAPAHIIDDASDSLPF
jgi:hypothetical protein